MVSVVSGFKRIAVLVTVLVMGGSSAAAQRARTPAGQPSSLDVAVALIRDGRVAEAEQKLVALLKTEPKNAGALNLLGTIRAQQNRLDEAEALWTRAVASDPQFAGPHMNLAYLYLLKGAAAKSIAELKEVVRLEPTNADAAFKLARLRLRSSRGRRSSSFRVPLFWMSIAGNTRLSTSFRSRWISMLPVPLNSSKITSSMREPVSMSAVAMIVSDPPSSIFRAAPKKRFGF